MTATPSKHERQTAAQKKAAAEADQYFTRPEVAGKCLDRICALLPRKVVQAAWWIEPSAGNGSFLTHLTGRKLKSWGGDLHPQHPAIHTHDYLKDPLPTLSGHTGKTIVVGNPPFGRKAKLAVAFINQALQQGGLVGFIVPIQLRKWSAQKHIQGGARLVMDIDLQEDAFLFLGEPYKLRSCFQVWTTWPERDLPGADLRLDGAPKLNHEDYEAWQYNCTKEALKYFDYDWDFAVLRQGYGDFSVLYSQIDKAQLDTRKQWIFIKAKTPAALARLRGLDFVKLSQRNTGTPGFGKADLLDAYLAAKG